MTDNDTKYLSCISDYDGNEYVIKDKEARTSLSNKQDVISDLSTIRSGASLGATALQSVPSTYALKTDIPTKVSKLTNDSGYLTSHQDISGKADKSTTYTKTEVDTALALKGNLTYEVQEGMGIAHIDIIKGMTYKEI